ncbi:MAG: chemotaxis-specific protein-glutamate methyltransferase CheB [Leptolyngbyaceae cyanobacterium bins.59]|nr:chemotaxis-specific protein-glutamate methyltransferase CheB [Leptolyngbyaceae cyanobacterium bins.59]
MTTPIAVLLVEDSPVVLTILKRVLEDSPDITVVGTARNGQEALDLIPQLQPKVICTDYHMPQMDGLEFIERVMAQFPRPILVISASVHPQEDKTNVFRLLKAGAVDVFPKPTAIGNAGYDALKQDLVNKIKILSGVTVFTRHPSQPNNRSAPRISTPIPPSPTSQSSTPKSSPTPQSGTSPLPPLAPRSFAGKTIKAIVVGTSTGGPQALYSLLTQLPATLPVPVICVQHISEGFLQGLVNWLAVECRLSVKIAQPGEIPLPGTVYFAPEGTHLEFSPQGHFVCQNTSPVDGHRPSATALFKSASKTYGANLMGILLTGMGRDGAAGMQDIALTGGITIAQDEQSCTVFGMPKEAIALGAVRYVLAIQEIPGMVVKILSGKEWT